MALRSTVLRGTVCPMAAHSMTVSEFNLARLPQLDEFGRPLALHDLLIPLHRHVFLLPVFSEPEEDEVPVLVGFRCHCGRVLHRNAPSALITSSKE
jgi:hypothetical protein